MTKNIPDLPVSLHGLTPFRPPLYGVERGKPERSGGGGEYMKKLKLKIVSSYFLI